MDMPTPRPPEIDVQALDRMAEDGADYVILDIREAGEVGVCAIEGSLHVPMGQIPYSLDTIPRDRDLIVLCHHGVRSWHAMNWLRGNGYDRAISLRGGIDAWAKVIDPAMATY